VACQPQPNENGERPIWIEERWLDKLNSIRGSSDSQVEPCRPALRPFATSVVGYQVFN
jgi:hypothetical protein